MKSTFWKFTPKLLKRFLEDFLEVSIIGKFFMSLLTLISLVCFILASIKIPITIIIGISMWIPYELCGVFDQKRNK